MEKPESTARGGAPAWLRRLLPDNADNRRLLLYVLGVVGLGGALLFHHPAQLRELATGPFLLWLLVSIVPARNEESIPIDLVPKPSEFSISSSQDGLTRTWQFVVVAA